MRTSLSSRQPGMCLVGSKPCRYHACNAWPPSEQHDFITTLSRDLSRHPPIMRCSRCIVNPACAAILPLCPVKQFYSILHSSGTSRIFHLWYLVWCNESQICHISLPCHFTTFHIRVYLLKIAITSWFLIKHIQNNVGTVKVLYRSSTIASRMVTFPPKKLGLTYDISRKNAACCFFSL